MTLHREIHRENEICADLAAAYCSYDAGDDASYKRAQALVTDDVLAWIKASQPKVWEGIE